MWKELAFFLFLLVGTGAFSQERGEGQQKVEPQNTTVKTQVDSLGKRQDSMSGDLQHQKETPVSKKSRLGRSEDSAAADTLPINTNGDGRPSKFMIIAGDTIPREFIGLEEVIILQRLKFTNLEERRRYLILKRRTHKVFPYAKLASERLVELSSRLERIESKRDQKRYIRIIQDYIEGEFKEELKKLTRSEGQILVKLIHRQTGETTFELIRDFRSGWNAFWYNTTASLFDISLKEVYHPKEVEEDFLIEDILQRAFQARELESQPSVLDFDYLELTDHWSEKTPASRSGNRPYWP